MIDNLTKHITTLTDKYAVTLNDIENDIKKTENELISMLQDLTGSEEDMKGINEFIRILGGDSHGY